MHSLCLIAAMISLCSSVICQTLCMTISCTRSSAVVTSHAALPKVTLPGFTLTGRHSPMAKQNYIGEKKITHFRQFGKT